MKIILKKNVKGNEQMVYDELQMLQKMKHEHIVRFVDWFESRVSRRMFGLLERRRLIRRRTNTILSHNWLLVESYLIGFVNKDDSRKKMLRKLFDKFSKLWITFMTITLFTGVGFYKYQCVCHD